MPSSRTAIAVTLPCTLALAVPALAAPGDNDKTSTVAVSDKVTRLSADLDRGSVTIRSGKVGSVQVTKHWRGTEPTVDVKVAKGVLTVTGHCPGLVNGPFVYVGTPVGVCSTDIVVTVQGSRLDTQVSTFGAVSLVGFAGKHELASGTGAVTVSRTSGGSLAVDTSGGDVVLKDLSAETVDVAASTGSVTVNRVTTRGQSKVATNGGDVRLDDVRAASFDLSSGTGSQALDRLTATAQVDVSTNGGPAAVSAVRANALQIRSGTGGVNVSDVTVASPLQVDSNGGRIAVRTSKAPSLVLSSGSGAIDLQDDKTAKAALTTNGGDVSSSGTAATTFDVSSGSGAVNVVTTTAPSAVTVDTNGGDIGLTVARGAYGLIVSQNGGTLVLDGISLNSGSSHKLDLTSGAGDITVRGR